MFQLKKELFINRNEIYVAQRSMTAESTDVRLFNR